MEITCQTDYSQKALAAMSLAARKTIRRRSNRIWSIYAWILSAVLLVSILVLHDSPLYTALEGALLVLLVTLQFKQDAFNAFCARRRLVPETRASRTVFYPDHYVVIFPAAETKWQYSRIRIPVETRDYFVLLLGKYHAHAVPKAALKGASPEEFRAFLAEKTGKAVRKIGRWKQP